MKDNEHKNHEIVENYVLICGKKEYFLYCRTCKKEIPKEEPNISSKSKGLVPKNPEKDLYLEWEQLLDDIEDDDGFVF